MPVVYLEFFPRDGLLENFHFLWYQIIQCIYQTGFLLDFEPSADYLKPWEEAVFERGLRWRVTDVGKNLEIPVQEVRHEKPAESLVHLGILCVAILFPEWTKKLGIEFPRVALPGIQAHRRNVVWNRSKYRKYDGITLHSRFVPVLTNERVKMWRRSDGGMYLEMHELFEGESPGYTSVPLFQDPIF